MAALEEPEQDKIEGDTDLSRRNADPPPSSNPTREAFLPAIAQTSEYVRLAKAGGHKGDFLAFKILHCLCGCVRR